MKTIEIPNVPGFVRLEASEGYFLRRIGDAGASTDNRTAIVAADRIGEWEEAEIAKAEAAKVAEARDAAYREDVVRRIRLRYSADDERAILRKMMSGIVSLQMDTHLLAEVEDADAEALRDPEAAIEEFIEYDRYAEQCKAEAKEANY